LPRHWLTPLAIAYAAAEQAGISEPERPSGWRVMGKVLKNWLVAIVLGSVAAVVPCLGRSVFLGVAISSQARGVESAVPLPFLPECATALPVAAGVMFVSSLVGLWSLAVRRTLRRQPHLHRLRRLLAWLRIVLALLWLGAMALIVLTLVA
jgi:hypothetical protein